MIADGSEPLARRQRGRPGAQRAGNRFDGGRAIQRYGRSLSSRCEEVDVMVDQAGQQRAAVSIQLRRAARKLAAYLGDPAILQAHVERRATLDFHISDQEAGRHPSSASIAAVSAPIAAARPLSGRAPGGARSVSRQRQAPSAPSISPRSISETGSAPATRDAASRKATSTSTP